MTRRQWIGITAMVLVVFGYAVAVSFIAEVKIDRMQDRISNTIQLEKRIAELECRHVMYEDGSTTHADAERVAECVYTAPVFAKYGD
jgi:hypothetical protein